MSSCEVEARRHFIEHNLKVDWYLANVTIEEMVAVQKFLKEYRRRQK